MEARRRITVQMIQEGERVWQARALELPEVVTERETPQRAARNVQDPALRHSAERLESGGFVPVLEHIAFDMPYFEPVAEH